MIRHGVDGNLLETVGGTVIGGVDGQVWSPVAEET